MGDLLSRIRSDRMVCVSTRMAGDGYASIHAHLSFGAGHDWSAVDCIESNLGRERASVAGQADVDGLD